jgi:hypothetical protein
MDVCGAYRQRDEGIPVSVLGLQESVAPFQSHFQAAAARITKPTTTTTIIPTVTANHHYKAERGMICSEYFGFPCQSSIPPIALQSSSCIIQGW